MKANQKGGTPPHDHARSSGICGTSGCWYQGNPELHLPRRTILGIAIGGPTLLNLPVCSGTLRSRRSLCSVVNAQQATQVIMAVQEQKITAQTGGGILYPPSHISLNHKRPSTGLLEGAVTALLLHFCLAAIDYASCSHSNFSSPRPSEPQ